MNVRRRAIIKASCNPEHRFWWLFFKRRDESFERRMAALRRAVDNLARLRR